MPLLEATEQSLPRSALRYRPIGKDTQQQGSHPRAMAGITPVARRASRLRPIDTEEDEEVVGGGPRADEEYAGAVLPPAQASPGLIGISINHPPKTPRLTRRSGKRRSILRGHPLLYLGLGMMGMLALWTLLTMAISWGNTTMDTIRYGYPRTFQIDQFVGHNESGTIPSHFIAINFHGRIEVIEFPGGDASHARIFLGPQLYTQGSDLAPVTLKFLDVNSDHRPDMLLEFEGSQAVFINDQGTFRPLRPEERHQVEQFLQAHGQEP
jgi:hypothetical protein